MGNFAGKEEESGDIHDRPPSVTEPGPPGAFEFQNEGLTDGEKTSHEMEIEPKPYGLPSDEELVPTVFRWEHGGRQVYITGTFNNWEHQIPMHRSGNDFTYIHNLIKGKHAFKFIVDDEWRFAPDQPTVADIEGRINNFIDVSDFVEYIGDENFLASQGENNDEVFSQIRPELDEYTKEPPTLPPHLRHIILNKVPPVNDPAALTVPQHVVLNHLYCTAIKDGMMVLGVTQRYSEKFVTTIYYSNI
jgi:5'-AMP-activated protein kinase regulatory beta subunit